MKKVILFVAVMLIGFVGKAQTYYVSQIAYNPLPFDTGIVVTAAIDDQWGQVLGIGFDFYFFGQAYQSLIVGTNGQISFNTANANTYETWSIAGPIPSTTAPDGGNTIMFPWQDVDCTNLGKVRHQVFGTPPNRMFVVSFDSMPFYGSPNSVSTGYCGTGLFIGQVILYEGSNNIEMHIKNKDTCVEWNAGLAVEGIQNATSTIAYTVPGRNATVWTAQNDAWRFSPDSAWSGPTNLNRISGRVFNDLNQNCVFDGSDLPLRNKPVIFTNDVTQAQTYLFTDLEGYYSKMVDTGHYSYTTYNLSNNLYASTCPPSGYYHVYFPVYIDSSDNNFFADTISQFCSSLTPGIQVANPNNFLGAVNSCDTAVVTIQCANNGTQSDSATLLLTMNDSVQVLSCSVAYTVVGGVYQLAVGRLNAGYDTTVTMLIKVGCDTLGTPYCFNLVAQGDYPTLCNYGSQMDDLCGVLGAPFDPNSMYVSSITHPEKGMVPYLETSDSDAFSYMVTFQNTGTAPAHNVELKIPLSSRIDSNSITPTIASFHYSWLVLNHALIVDFTGINLPDTAISKTTSEGYFKFRVKQKAGNVAGDSIIHTAAIYFDQNTAVITNRAIVKIVADTVATGLFNPAQSGVVIYPNPGHSSVQIVTPEMLQLKITDATGRLVYAQQLTSLNSNFDVSKWATGIYLVSVYSEKYNAVFKFIKD